MSQVVDDPVARVNIALAAFWNRPSLAEHLGRSTAALDRDNALGRIPRPIRIGRVLRWSRVEIQQWIEAGAAREQWEAMKKAASR